MRILHVVPSYIPAWRYGGPIHSVHGLCKALATRGHDVNVATTNVDGDRDSNVALGVPVDLGGVKVHYFESRRLRRLYYSGGMYAYLKQSMAGWDLVHTHSVFLWPTSAAAHLARRHARPYVLSPRGMLVRDLIARRSPMLKRSWIALFEKRNVNRAAAVHVTSALEGQEMRAMGFEPRHVFEVPNGWDDPSEAADAQSGGDLPPLPERYVLFLGRISWKKGLDRLAAAMAHVADAQLVVAGNDDENYWPEVERAIDKAGVRARVHRIGYVQGKAKEQLITGASLLVLPSYSENFGNVILEAMARGVPVVVTPEVGLASVIQTAEAGLVSDGEPRALAAAIASIRGDEARRARLGANARAAAAEYSWGRIAERMEAHYLRIVEAHGAA